MRTASGSLILHGDIGHDQEQHVGGQALKRRLHELESISDRFLSGQLFDVTLLHFVYLEGGFSTAPSWGFDDNSMY